MPWTDATEQAMLNHLLTDPAFTPAATQYLGLSTTTPTDAGSNFTEPSGNGYARVSNAAADWAAATGTAPATKTNTSVLSFPQATGSWGTVTHYGLFSASSAGTLYAWGALTSSKAVANGDTLRFAASSLILKCGKPADSY